MKHLLIIAGAGFIAYHFMKGNTANAVATTNPDSAGTTVQSGVGSPSAIPGTATSGMATPVAAVIGTQSGANPASLGSDNTAGTAAAQVNSPDPVITNNTAFERLDYVNPFNRSFAQLER